MQAKKLQAEIAHRGSRRCSGTDDVQAQTSARCSSTEGEICEVLNYLRLFEPVCHLLQQITVFCLTEERHLYFCSGHSVMF